MEERIAKIEKRTKVNMILLSVITALIAALLIAIIVITMKVVPVVREYQPVFESLSSIDVESLNEGIEACKKIGEADIDMNNIAQALKQLDTMQESMNDFKDIMPKIEVIADAISSLSEKLEKIGNIFGR